MAMTARWIIDRIAARPCPLVGCVRQRKLMRDLPLSWRFARGDAVLAQLGARTQINTDVGPFDAFIARTSTDGSALLVWRSGQRRPWWNEDVELTLACAQVYGALVDGAILVQELDSELSTHYIERLDPAKARTLVEAAKERFNATARIQKNGPRGRGQCLHCPVKAECDFIDLSRNETSDWPEGYVPA